MTFQRANDDAGTVTPGIIQSGLFPNFLILGAAKSGTSSLYRYLSQHPDIFMTSFKEPHFFVWGGREYDIRGPGVERVARRVITDLDTYSRLFVGSEYARVRGEASTGYLHTPGVAERIREYVPDAKLMVILRNPIDRAYSAFLHAQREGFEPLSSFEDALKEEPRRIEDRWIGLTLYTTVGMYAEQIGRFLAVFPCTQLKVYLFDDFSRDPVGVSQDAFRYLEVSDSFEPDVSTRANRGASVRSARLQSIATGIRKTALARRLPSGPAQLLLRALNEHPIKPLSDAARHQVAPAFEADVARLSDVLLRDLTPWLEGRTLPPLESGAALGAHPCVKQQPNE